MKTHKYQTAPLRNPKQEVLNQISKINERLEQSRCVHNGFLGGSLGLLFYYYNYHLTINRRNSRDIGRRMLEKVFDDINNENSYQLAGPFLCAGAAGFSHVVHFLCRHKLINFDPDRELKYLDEYLFESAKEAITMNNIDYLHGATGIIHYFSLQRQSKKNDAILNLLLDMMFQKIVVDKRTVCFRNASMDNQEKSEIDLGLAHGLAGFLLIVMYAWEKIRDKAKAISIIGKSTEFILASRSFQPVIENRIAIFPVRFNKLTNEASGLNRLAWCYGDLNQMLLLYRAGKLLKKSEYIKIANQVGLRAIERTHPNSTLVEDSFFCHGSSGIAQIFKTLFFETEIPIYLDAYFYWINQTLMFSSKELISQKEHVNHTGLLEGLTGTAMVLTDFISPKRADWSKIFLL